MNEYINVPPKFTRVHSLRNKMSITRGAKFGESIHSKSDMFKDNS